MKCKSERDQCEEERDKLSGEAWVLRDKLAGAVTDRRTLDSNIIELQDTIQPLTAYNENVDNQAGTITLHYATQLIALQYQVQQLTSQNSKLRLANDKWRTLTEAKQSEEEFEELKSKLNVRWKQVEELQERTAALEHCVAKWPTKITDESAQLKMDALEIRLQNHQSVIEAMRAQDPARRRGGKSYHESRDKCIVQLENLKNYGLHYPVMLEEIKLAHEVPTFVPGSISFKNFDREANEDCCYHTQDYEPYDVDVLFPAISERPVVRIPNSVRTEIVAEAAPPTDAVVHPYTRWTVFGQKREECRFKKRGKKDATMILEEDKVLEHPEQVEEQITSARKQQDDDVEDPGALSKTDTLPALTPLATLQQPGVIAANVGANGGEPVPMTELVDTAPTQLAYTNVASPEKVSTTTEATTTTISAPESNSSTPHFRVSGLEPKKAEAGMQASRWAVSQGSAEPSYVSGSAAPGSSKKRGTRRTGGSRGPYTQ